jgi:hypothetical protein
MHLFTGRELLAPSRGDSMAGSVLCLVTLTLGMDAGWRQLPDGGMEYIIQIESHVLDSLRSGAEIESDIPPKMRDLRSYRITVGTGELPRDIPIERPSERFWAPETRPSDEGAKSSRYGEGTPPFPWAHVPQTLPPSEVGWRRLPGGGMEYIIQIEPHLLDTLRSGSEIVSKIPPNLRDLRSCRITVGTGKLRQDAPPEPTPEESTSPSAPLFPWPEVPRTLPEPTDIQRLSRFPEKPTAFAESPDRESEPAVDGSGTEKPAKPTEAAESEEPNATPGALSLTLAAVSASCVGGMLFVGWVAWDYRRQYHVLLRRVLDDAPEGVAMDDVRISEAERQAASASPKSS